MPELDVDLQEFLAHTDVYGNTVQRWLVALGIFLGALLALRIARGIVVSRTRKLAERLERDWMTAIANVLHRTRFLFLVVLSLYFGSLALMLPERTVDVIRSVAVIALLLQGAIWGNALLTHLIDRYVQQRMETDAASVTTVTALGFLAKLALWVIVVLLGLENVGVDVTALVAGLGIGGIAVALAAQNVLGDLFASLSIVLDKPFVLGDFINVGEYVGSVERIGLKTTRIRSLTGEQLVFSNNDLLQSRLRNYKRMQQRRIAFTIGVTYETSADKLDAIPGMIREIIEGHEQARFDRAHFKSYGDFALIFEIVYFVVVPDYNTYMDLQQDINLRIFRRFEEAGIDFAYPTQTIFLQQQPAS